VCWSFHHGGETGLFCDAHVEAEKSELIQRRQYPNSYYANSFVPDEAHAKRWNYDNEPHPETWPKTP
jgi:hypothetical protein